MQQFDSTTRFHVIDYVMNDDERLTDKPVTFDGAINVLTDHVAHLLSLNFDSDCDEQSTFTFKFHRETGNITLYYERAVIAVSHAIHVDDAPSFVDLCTVQVNTCN